MRFRRIFRNFRKKFSQFLIGSTALLVFNEFLIYYLVIVQCSWPTLENSSLLQEEPLKAMILADPHLLGPRRGHWFDKLRREWQMFRSFQAANTLFEPEVVFILGDIFDEGSWVNPQEFRNYVRRFHSIFYVNPSTTKLIVIVGNHDIGFHYVITPALKNRFEKVFNSSSVQLVKFRNGDVNFVLINSMAMERDGCFLCAEAKRKLGKVASELELEPSKTGGKKSHPILLQHFPLYRNSDSACKGDDVDPDKHKEFRQNWDCLSKTSTKILLDLLRPRLVLSGHTHHGCLHNHSSGGGDQVPVVMISEYSVPSFSWRNRDNPSFFLGVFSRSDYKLGKCSMPKESTVKLLYVVGTLGLFIICFCTRLQFFLYRRIFRQ